MQLRLYYLMCFCVFGFLACDINADKTEENKGLLAEVYDAKLTKVDLAKSYEGQSIDSTTERQLVHLWVKQNIIAENAKRKISSTDYIDQLVEDYKNDLLIHEYEQQYIAAQLNQEVSKEEIKAYYDLNKDDFLVANAEIQLLLCKIPSDDPGLSLFVDWWKSINMDEINRFCQEHEFMCILDDDIWHQLDDIKVLLPESLHKALEKGKNLRQKSNKFEYFVKTTNFRSKASSGTLEMNEADLIRRIVFERKKKLIKELHESLYDEAIEKNKVKLYLDD